MQRALSARLLLVGDLNWPAGSALLLLLMAERTELYHHPKLFIVIAVVMLFLDLGFVFDSTQSKMIS